MEHFIRDHIYGKGFLLICLALGGIIIFLVRKISLVADKASTLRIIERIKKKPERAKDVIDSLDIPYSEKGNFPSDHFETLKTFLMSKRAIGNYTIVYACAYGSDQVLVFTELAYVDFDVNVAGSNSFLNKYAYHTFVLKHESAENKLIVFSGLYSDTTGKFQNEEFMKAVFGTGI